MIQHALRDALTEFHIHHVSFKGKGIGAKGPFDLTGYYLLALAVIFDTITFHM